MQSPHAQKQGNVCLPGYGRWSWKLAADRWVALKIWQSLRGTVYTRGCQGDHLRHGTRACQKKAQQLQDSCHGALRFSKFLQRPVPVQESQSRVKWLIIIPRFVNQLPCKKNKNISSSCQLQGF